MYAVGSGSSKAPIRFSPMKDFVLKPRYEGTQSASFGFQERLPVGLPLPATATPNGIDNFNFLKSALHNGHSLVHMAILQMFLARMT